MADVVIDGRTLSPEQVAAVANGARVRLDPDAAARMTASARTWADRGDPHLLRSKWQWLIGGEAPERRDDLVARFLADHCAGVGEPLPDAEVRALIAVRANVLAVGHSGVRPVVVERLLSLLEGDCLPVVPSVGPVGAAGSSALAHVARVALGLGGRTRGSGRAPEPLAVNENEALSLINGSSLTTALGALAVQRAERLLASAQAACALSMEVVRADRRCLDPRAAEVRGHPGVAKVAATLSAYTFGSQLVREGNRPDAFCIRCAPTVIGAAVDALAFVRQTVQRELNGAGDNPLVFADGVVEAGHFHGAPVALAMDTLKAALVQVASIAERRVFRLTYGQLSGLPSFLVPGTGANSGLMLAQYTAASLVAEARGRAVPGSTDSIPTVQHHEDHVSMGPVAARTALQVVDLVSDVVGIELLAAAQGLDFRLSGEAVVDGELVSTEVRAPGPGTRRVYEAVRRHVTRWHDDRVLHTDLDALGEAVRAGHFVGLA
jgi:histidine ammonia-lyase